MELMNFNQQECKKCGRQTYNKDGLCGPCKAHINSYPNCKYYQNIQKTVEIPYCNYFDFPILGIDGSYYCHKCKNKEQNSEVIAWKK